MFIPEQPNKQTGTPPLAPSGVAGAPGGKHVGDGYNRRNRLLMMHLRVKSHYYTPPYVQQEWSRPPWAACRCRGSVSNHTRRREKTSGSGGAKDNNKLGSCECKSRRSKQARTQASKLKEDCSPNRSISSIDSAGWKSVLALCGSGRLIGAYRSRENLCRT